MDQCTRFLIDPTDHPDFNPTSDITSSSSDGKNESDFSGNNQSEKNFALQTEICGKKQLDPSMLLTYHKVFGWSNEALEDVILTLGNLGQEAVTSMGDDVPMAVLSSKPRDLCDYFRQMFAQVTNPPIDPLRERHVMSLATCIGRERNVFNETLGHAWRVLFSSPILVHTDMDQLKALDPQYYQHEIIDLNYKPEPGQTEQGHPKQNKQGLESAIKSVCDRALNAVKNKTVLVILSDRSISSETLPIPAAMAVGAVHHALVENNHRCDANIIVETACARDPHQFAVLLGMGATAIYPYLAYESLAQLHEDRYLDVSLETAILNFRKGIDKGLLKVLSKMGISTIASYRSAQLFETVGLSNEVVDLCFKGIASRIEGADFNDIETDLAAWSRSAWNQPHIPLNRGGLFRYVHGQEYHCYNPDVVQSLQHAVTTHSFSSYQTYSEIVNNRPVSHLRDLLQLKKGNKTNNNMDSDSTNPPSPMENRPISLEAVEPETEFYKRFDAAAMSIGALSQEAHEALAVAMNRLGGFSNSGEGGEDPNRFNTEKVSKIKQVASGRFGVTPGYLVNAEVLQIKMAQGAKPGEGGQLPGHKVTAQIAALRYSTPGITLISPPPHHDIYSIEDLAQLIFDLKQVNPKAQVSVKLVSEPGVGTIAHRCG